MNAHDLSQLFFPVAIHAGHTALPSKTGFLIICSFSTEGMVISTLDTILALMNSTASMLPLCIILRATGKCNGTLRKCNREACARRGWVGELPAPFFLMGGLVMCPGFQNTWQIFIKTVLLLDTDWSLWLSHGSS